MASKGAQAEAQPGLLSTAGRIASCGGRVRCPEAYVERIRTDASASTGMSRVYRLTWARQDVKLHVLVGASIGPWKGTYTLRRAVENSEGRARRTHDLWSQLERRLSCWLNGASAPRMQRLNLICSARGTRSCDLPWASRQTCWIGWLDHASFNSIWRQPS